MLLSVYEYNHETQSQDRITHNRQFHARCVFLLCVYVVASLSKIQYRLDVPNIRRSIEY